MGTLNGRLQWAQRTILPRMCSGTTTAFPQDRLGQITVTGIC
jgi:hypothetical protein